MSDHFADHQRVVAAAADQIPTLECIADRIVSCFRAGGRLYVFGNGGSAADAQHIAAEFVGRFKRDRRALPAIALTTDTSVLTAVCNDTGIEQCFARQVDALVTASDVVWALSVSGRSPNVIRAMERARDIDACRIGFTGRTGDPLAALCDHCFRADHESSDRVQEVHQLAYHVVCERVEAACG
ncbi:MAG: SIS domain-containing protein [Phycisphaerae bacterium]